MDLSRLLPPASALGLAWGLSLASLTGGQLGGLQHQLMWPCLFLLGTAGGTLGLALAWGSARPGERVGQLPLSLTLAAALGPWPLVIVAALGALQRRAARRGEGVVAAWLRGALATALGLTVVSDAWAGRSLLARALWSHRQLPPLPELSLTQWLVLLVPALQLALAAAIARPREALRSDASHHRRGEWLPLSLTAVAALIILGGATWLALDAPWTVGWGRHIHARQHVAIGLALFGALRLLVVVAEHPLAPRPSGVAATTVAASGVLTMAVTDSLSLALPMLLGALVVGGAPRARAPRRRFGQLPRP